MSRPGAESDVVGTVIVVGTVVVVCDAPVEETIMPLVGASVTLETVVPLGEM